MHHRDNIEKIRNHPNVGVRGALTVLFLVLISGNARANDAPRTVARKHFNAAVTLIKQEKLDAAVSELLTSISLYPTKAGRYNLANCYRALGQYAEALDQFEKLQAEYGDKLEDETRRDIETQIAELKQLIEASSPLTPKNAPVSTSLETDRPAPPFQKEKPKIFRFLRKGGAVGTLVFASLSGAFWGSAVAQKNTHNTAAKAFNRNLDENKYDLLDPEDRQNAADERHRIQQKADRVRHFNAVAIGMTAVTGVSLAAAIIGYLMTKRNERPAPVTVSGSPSGVTVHF
jgi:tetratricopeptide (TPR) repeat protein